MEREKALDMALGQIEKQFGKGAIMRMGEDTGVKVAVIPSGALALDLALGVGGYPRGRVVELYGPESSGKCLVAGTYLWSDRGLETIEELFARVGQPVSCTSRVTDVREHEVRLVNGRGELETVAAVTHNYRRPTWRVMVQSGRSVTATANHPLRVLSEQGEIVWRHVCRLQAGDVLVSAMFGADEANGHDGVTVEEATLLGYLVAEGTLGRRSALCFTNHHDADVLAEYVALLDCVLGVPAAAVKTYGEGDHVVHNTAVRRRLCEEYGLDYVKSAAKSIPQRVRTSGAKAQRAFLSALFEGDGWIQAGPEVALTSASPALAEQVQLMLLGLGIPCSRSAKWNAKYERDYWTVWIPPGAVQRFLDIVGFRSARRAQQVKRHLRSAKVGTRWEAVPFIAPLVTSLRDALGGDRELDKLHHDLTRTDLCGDGSIEASRARLKQIVRWADAREIPPENRPLVERLRFFAEAPYTYERITAIEEAGPQPTFDVVLPQTHSFLANGIVSHNTTVALHAIAEAQKAGGIAAFIDAEHALDPTYAAAIGVDMEQLLVSQPDTGEQGLEITDMLVRSGAVDLVVIDSVAALTPRAEIEGEMGDTHVGLQARLMSQALRKLAGTLNRSRTCCIFINQLREKIGVMFGCFSYGTRVTLADGSQERIGKIVNQRLPVEVLSFDRDTGQVVPRRVVDWFDNGRADGFLQFTVGLPGGNGRAQFACTPNHLISTPAGWREAGELARGDQVLQTVTWRLSDFQWEVLLGGLMGDGALSPSRSGLAARFRFGHGSKQVAYADWKASLFANLSASRSTNAKGAVFYDIQPLPELAELRQAVYRDGKKVLSDDYLKRLTPLALAIWYLDDGCFTVRSKGVQRRTAGGTGRAEICVEAIEEASRHRLRLHLADSYGIESKLLVRAGKAIMQFPTAQTERLQSLVAPYVHPSMDYKLLPRFRGRFAVQPEFVEARRDLMPVPIVAIGPKPPTRSMHRFDLEVEGTHNYFVDGVMVHNSPEVTPGGRALKFYSSMRLDVRRIESLKDGTDFVGNRVRVKVVKNKCVAEGTRVFDLATATMRRVEDLVETTADVTVFAADKKGALHARKVTAFFDQGVQDVIALSLRDGTTVRVTPNHRILTESGWKLAGSLRLGDRVARPRRAGSFGEYEPVPVEHARLLGYLIGDGYVGGKTPIGFINVEEALHDDVAAIAATLGCKVTRARDGIYARISHHPGELNGVLAMARRAGIWGHLAPDKRLPAVFFDLAVSSAVVANVLMGLWETDGWLSREQTGGVRVGFTTTSEQLAWQVHWLLLRFGITSAVQRHQPGSRRSVIAGRRVVGKLACYQVRVSGLDNVARFAEALPMWGPKGSRLVLELGRLPGRHRGARSVYLSSALTEPVLSHLRRRGVTATFAADVIGGAPSLAAAGLRAVLGSPRLRRDRLEKLASTLDDPFLHEVLEDELFYDRIAAISDPVPARTYDLAIDELHNFVAEGIVVHNCAAPFKQAEFDILFGQGISTEGSLLDIGVEHGVAKKSGAWYTYDGEQLGQGRENARAFLKEHPDVAAEIAKKVTELLGLVPTDVVGDVDAPVEVGG